MFPSIVLAILEKKHLLENQTWNQLICNGLTGGFYLHKRTFLCLITGMNLTLRDGYQIVLRGGHASVMCCPLLRCILSRQSDEYQCQQTFCDAASF